MSTSFDALIQRIESNAEIRKLQAVKPLSLREMQVFERCGEGLSTKEVAADLGLSSKTIDVYVEHLKNKLQLASIHKLRAIAAVWVYRKNLPKNSTPGRPSVEAALDFCRLLRDRTDEISEEEFHSCLHRAIRCDRSYSAGVFISFKNNPAAFLAHRQPQTQSVELLKVILALPVTKEST